MVDTIAITCPSCGGLIELSPTREGVELECPDCETLLTLIALDPPELAPAFDADNEGHFGEDERRE